MKWEPVDKETARSIVGEGVHTGLRKGCEYGHPAWEAISKLPDGEWSSAIRFFLWGLDVMGMAICEKVPE